MISNKEDSNIMMNNPMGRTTIRDFLRQAGCAVTGSIIMISVLPEIAKADTDKPVLKITPEERAAILASDGYLIVDPQKCQGCLIKYH